MAGPHRIVVSRRAMTDLERLEAFIAVASIGKAKRAIARLVEGIGRLALQPESGKAIDGAFRELILPYGKSAYIVRYEVRDDLILVTHIWHGKEDRST